ncbi:MAG: hypothetical protein ACOCXW_00285 [Bacteroidota bacterium]
MEIETGTVVYWRQFRPRNYGGEIKPVYMLCLGRDPITCDTIFTYLHRFTTQKDAGNYTILFDQHKYPNIFTESCVLNFNERGYEFPFSYIRENTGDIEIKGKLYDDDLRRVLKMVNKSPQYSPIVRIAIRDSFSRIGITLKK